MSVVTQSSKFLIQLQILLTGLHTFVIVLVGRIGFLVKTFERSLRDLTEPAGFVSEVAKQHHDVSLERNDGIFYAW